MKKVVFVCTGNTCRSSMAEALFKKMLSDLGKHKEIEVFSCGIGAIEGQPASENAKKVMEMEGIDLEAHRAKPFTRDMLEADLILTMTQSHKDYIINRFPEAKGKVFTLGEFAGDNMEISDPFGHGVEVYKMVAEEIKQKLRKVIERLENN
ncbi:MAG: low molecular weight protein arginine phosphatase [Tepidanaerobacter acetatoxydans]|uniref:low molecular weight protein arginine phosphatase n=1 Tax=Tepidanaerobacter TaxID=499228 RepID=UPI000AB19262|nr:MULTISPECIES: low molecular weight protein arginine phosphatase [Tepidanaerobacter]NLU10197.1 low molecular weight protein arginine phosphatase [Tepidanaerobacter acetatoxydans]